MKKGNMMENTEPQSVDVQHETIGDDEMPITLSFVIRVF